MPVADAPDDDGNDAPRSSYNFAPGYYGAVYRADTPDHGAGPAPNEAAGGVPHDENDLKTTSYKLQSMKWGLIPFWTKRNPDYASMLKTINCRSDSLSTPGGMWATMKARKRCIVIAQGFYEWLKTGPKDKLPHYVKRADGQLMCFAGLWDCARYEGPWIPELECDLLVLTGQDSDEKQYTFTIITTDSNKQLKFLHDRMPVILEPGSDAMRQWLDPSMHEWSRDLQSLLQPFAGEVEVYPVSKDVGKVGNNSPAFIRPLYSKENKSNIANFFSSPKNENTRASPAKSEDANAGVELKVEKRKHVMEGESPRKKPATQKTISSTHNVGKKPPISSKGTQKITSFFSK